ncbi:MAG TPA: hypothetical protein VMM82_00785, partial [Spirochaetia bacterium]|nr:hypothetical protein [Spirochaetia bacterium]
QAHARYVLATDLAAFLLAVLIVLLASRIKVLLSPLALVLVIAALGLVFVGDVVIWLTRGIRSIEVDEQSLTLYRGRDLKARVITRQEVVGLVIQRRLMRRTVTVRLSRLKAVRITEEAFSPEAFSRFLSVLAGWDQRN